MHEFFGMKMFYPNYFYEIHILNISDSTLVPIKCLIVIL